MWSFETCLFDRLKETWSSLRIKRNVVHLNDFRKCGPVDGLMKSGLVDGLKESWYSSWIERNRDSTKCGLFDVLMEMWSV